MMLRVKRNGLLYRLLTIEITSTTDRQRAERSRFTWGLVDDRCVLRVLGVLHGLFKLTLWIEDE